MVASVYHGLPRAAIFVMACIGAQACFYQPLGSVGVTDEASTASTGEANTAPTGGTETGSGATMTGTTAMTTMAVDTTTSTGPGTSETAGTSIGTTMGVDTSSSTSGPDTTTTGTSSSTGANTTEGDCQMMQATLKPVAPNMMLVLDKSGSMVTDPTGYWDHDGDANTPKITRWNSLYQTVQSIVSDFNATINFGANLFPSLSAKKVYDPTACPVNAKVEVPVAPMNKDAVLNGIPQAGNTLLVGGTPTFAGVSSALNHLKSLDPTVPRAILLVTDGAANCTMGLGMPGNYGPLFEVYDQSVHTLVENAWTVDQIPTYVVGIVIKDEISSNSQDGYPNGVNTYTKLNELAVQGGKPKDDPVEKFYNTVNQIQLQAALDAIAEDTLSCVIALDGEPDKPDQTTVEVLGIDVMRVMDCTKQNGWVYTNPNGPFDAIELCGTSCTELKQAGEAEVTFPCVPD